MMRKTIKTLDGADLVTQVVRRKFIPVTVELDSPGRYQSFQVKIPHRTNKVVGVIITHDDQADPIWIYIGASYVGDGDNLIDKLQRAVITTAPYRFQAALEELERIWLLYPAELSYPTLMLNGSEEGWVGPQEMFIENDGGEEEAYNLWYSQDGLTGPMKVEITPAEEESEEET